MLIVTDVKNYLAEKFTSYDFYAGTIDRDKDKSIGIYPSQSTAVRIALGGLNNTSYNIIPIRILIHWTKNTSSCEGIAVEIYEHLLTMDNAFIGEHRIIKVDMLDSYPIDLSRDERGICEMIIRANIYYER